MNERLRYQKKSWLRMKSFSSTLASTILHPTASDEEEGRLVSRASASRRFWKRGIAEDENTTCPNWSCKCLASVPFILLLFSLTLRLPLLLLLLLLWLFLFIASCILSLSSLFTLQGVFVFVNWQCYKSKIIY